MKAFLAFIVVLAASNFAQACPDLSGKFEFVKDWNGQLEIKQNNCDSIEIRKFDHKDNKWDFTITYKIDSKNYEGVYYRHVDEEFDIDYTTEGVATSDTPSFHKVEFIGETLSIKRFSGSKQDCGSSHAYNNSKCKITEDTYRLENGSVIKAQIAHSWVDGGFYSGDEFYTVKK